MALDTLHSHLVRQYGQLGGTHLFSLLIEKHYGDYHVFLSEINNINVELCKP